jgi:uncharacterized protein (DUF952 family)
MNLAYKIVSVHTWNEFNKKQTHLFYGCLKDVDRGSIHMSTKDQLNKTIEKICDKNVNYYVLTINLDKCLNIIWINKYPHSQSALRLGVDIIEINKL